MGGTVPMERAYVTGYETIQPTLRHMKTMVENKNHIKKFTHHTQKRRNFIQLEAHGVPVQAHFQKKLKPAGGWKHTLWWRGESTLYTKKGYLHLSGLWPVAGRHWGKKCLTQVEETFGSNR